MLPVWDRIGQQLRNGAAAILPIGAGAKEHGFHMPMATDQVFADYFARALAKKIDALIWPTLTYGAYPAFVSYAGSVSLSNKAFQAVVTEIADALVDFGARRVLILNTGLSTIAPVGSHADEIETSLMMVVAPELVDMAQATPSPFSAKAPRPARSRQTIPLRRIIHQVAASAIRHSLRSIKVRGCSPPSSRYDGSGRLNSARG
jgi:creatinine amidohydrolase/Fe(II)-dependent formamide hydrolase-like protein